MMPRRQFPLNRRADEKNEVRHADIRIGIHVRRLLGNFHVPAGKMSYKSDNIGHADLSVAVHVSFEKYAYADRTRAQSILEIVIEIHGVIEIHRIFAGLGEGQRTGIRRELSFGSGRGDLNL